MIERVVENWLTNASERALEIPFCHVLLSRGYRVVHLSRHSEHEQGKDVLAVDPTGTPCAFQLKSLAGRKLSQAAWAELQAQIERLRALPIVHPSIPDGTKRRTFLVVNGELDETVRQAVVGLNTDARRRRLPKLETIVKGDLLAWLKELQSSFWPREPEDVHRLLSLYLKDGRGVLDKADVAGFLESLLPLRGERAPLSAIARQLAAAAVFTGYALAPFHRSQNHIAVIEGWTLYAASVLATAERLGLEEPTWEPSFDLALEGITAQFDSLAGELGDIERRRGSEGEALADHEFRRPRLTWTAGLLAWYVLWLQRSDRDERRAAVLAFLEAHEKHLVLWGEAAVPSFLALGWMFRTNSGRPKLEAYVHSLVEGIVVSSREKDASGLADPYHDIEDVVRRAVTPDDVDREDFRWRSNAIDGLFKLMARMNLQQAARRLWPEVTRFSLCSFRPAPQWRYLTWHSERGEGQSRVPPPTQSWAALRKASSRSRVSIPRRLAERPLFLLLYLLVCPHRLRTDVVLFLDAALARLPGVA